ncbi:MAG: MFS transporter [Chloroflexi bacterium]|nr:MFS transporter [Chloroflexota bacterium]
MGIAAKITNDRRLALGSVFLVANALIWYTSAANILTTIIVGESQQTLLWTLHFSALLISLFIGVFLIKKIGKKTLFLVWTIIGVFSPLTLFGLNFGGTLFALLAAVFFGISLGLGMPSCMAYFTDLTEAKNRGHYGGLIMLFSGLGGITLGVLGGGNIESTAAVLIVWRAIGLAFVFRTDFQEKNVEKREVSFAFVLKQRAFMLYLIPWLMFSLVGYLSVPIQSTVLTIDTIRSLVLVESIIIGIFSIISGFLIDVGGRKRIAIIAFVLVGIEFAILGLSSGQMLSWVIYTVLDGIVWGILYVLFVLSIWGDLGQNASTDKYYAIGILPFFLSKYLQLVIGGYVAANIRPYMLFSFTAFFLFLAVLPLVYAPETLPEKVMKDRDLKSYVENAKKKVQKETEKVKKKEANAP